MGIKSEETLSFANVDQLMEYLTAKHSVYMTYAGKTYYLTDVNDIYWRAQDVEVLNEKGHYTDCSELIPLVRDFIDLPFADGKSVRDCFADAVFNASEKKAE